MMRTSPSKPVQPVLMRTVFLLLCLVSSPCWAESSDDDGPPQPKLSRGAPESRSWLQSDIAVAQFLKIIPPSICASAVNNSKGVDRKSLFHDLQGDLNKHMLLDEKHRIVMDWSPKAACTKAVEMFWNGMNITRGVYYPQLAFVHAYRFDFFVACGTVSQQIMDSPEYYKFKVVRSPYYRAVSSYIHIMKMKLLTEVEHTHRQKLDIRPLTDLSFEEFLTVGMTHRSVFSESAQAHFKTQSSDAEMSRFRKHLPPIFNRIVRLENLDEDIALVNKDTKMNYSFPEVVRMHEVEKRKLADVYCGNMTFSDLLQGGIPEDYGKFYSRRTKHMVSVVFANDFKLYNYTFPFDKLY